MKNQYLLHAGIEGVRIEDLKIIDAPGGPVLRMLRGDELETFFPDGIGEVYFSEVEPGAVKAWKLHTKQHGLFAVPVGRIKLVLFDARAESSTLGVISGFDLGRPDNYKLLRIPRGVWYGFKCVSKTSALICNCADMEHDPGECLRKPVNDPEIPYNWATSQED